METPSRGIWKKTRHLIYYREHYEIWAYLDIFGKFASVIVFTYCKFLWQPPHLLNVPNTTFIVEKFTLLKYLHILFFQKYILNIFNLLILHENHLTSQLSRKILIMNRYHIADTTLIWLTHWNSTVKTIATVVTQHKHACTYQEAPSYGTTERASSHQ